MSDKFIAGLVTAAAVAPLCVLCIIGPAALGSTLAALAAWLAGFDLWTTALASAGAAALAYGLLEWRRRVRQSLLPAKEIRPELIECRDRNLKIRPP